MNRFQAMTAILRSDLSTIQRLIVLSYIEHQNSDIPLDVAASYPSTAALAGDCGASERTVIRHRNMLVEAGVLVVVSGAGGGRTSLKCRVDMSKVNKRPERKHKPKSKQGVEGCSHVTPDTVSPQVCHSDTAPLSERQGTPVKTAHEPPPYNHPHTTTPIEPPLVVQQPLDRPVDLPEPDAELPAEPLWKQVGCPPPGDTVKAKHLTKRILSIYAAWWKRYDAWCSATPGKRNGFHEMHASDLDAIKSALKRRPSGIVGPDAVDQWPIDRLVKATLAAPMAFPDGHDRAWTRKKGGWMRPSFTLRNGTTRNQWEEAAKAAVELAEQGSPTLPVGSDARDDSTASQGPLRLPSAEAVAGRLWSVYLSASPSARRSVAGILGRDDMWDSWLTTSQGVISMGEALKLSEWDAKFRRKDYVRVVADWARREGVAS